MYPMQTLDEFIRRQTPKESQFNTHHLLDGGSFATPDGLHSEFHQFVVNAVSSHTMRPISELHSVEFPLFVDVDLKVEVPVLPSAFKEKLAQTCSQQVCRFYAKRTEESTFDSLICNKSGPPKPYNDTDKNRVGKVWLAMSLCELDAERGQGWVVEVTSREIQAAIQEEYDKTKEGSRKVTLPADKYAPFDGFLSLNHRVTLSDGSRLRPMGEWKHGLHIHWPNLIVNVDQAVQMRESIVSGLEAENYKEDTALDLRRNSDICSPFIAWDIAIDSKVYNKHPNSGGLRLVFAPKAEKCKEPHCPGKAKGKSDLCPHHPRDATRERRGGHVYDDSMYKVDFYISNGEVNTERTLEYKRSARKTLADTSVRNYCGKPLTEGFKVYSGCPPVPDQKKKRNGSSSQYTQIFELAMLDVARRLLKRHSPHYEHSVVNLMKHNTREYMVAKLSGDGATFCANKESFHHSMTSYMEIKMVKQKLYSVIRCNCPCMVKRGRGVLCKDYESYPMPVEDSDALALGFVTKAACTGVQRAEMALRLAEKELKEKRAKRAKTLEDRANAVALSKP
jgi:hypothetical protein